jgi:hypothetical protein
MYEAYYRSDTEPAEVVETFVGPAPVKFVQTTRGGAFPQDWITHSFDAQRSETIQIANA